MRMIVRVLLLLTHLFILFYKEGIHMINFNIPPFTGKETEYMTKAIQNHKISGDGEFTKKCNKWIEDKTGTAKALLTTSCTHATEMAALLADIKPGDEVIMPSYTFVSTADAFVLRGATAVFVDIRPDTMNIDETLIEDAILIRQEQSFLYTMPVFPARWIRSWISQSVIIFSLSRMPHRALCPPIKERLSEQSVITAVSASTKQRTTAWVRAAAF